MVRALESQLKMSHGFDPRPVVFGKRRMYVAAVGGEFPNPETARQ